MPDDVLGLLITGTLNQGLSVGQINKDLKKLSRHPSLQKLKVNISIDENFIKNLSSFSKNINIITQQLNQQSTANNNLNSGLSNTTQTIQNQTKATNEAIAAEKKWQVERERTNSKGATTSVLGNNFNNDKKIQKVNADDTVQFEYTKNQLKDYKAFEALDRDHFNAIKTNKKMIEDLEKVHYLALQKNRDLDWKNLQASNKQAETLDKAHYQAIKLNDEKIERSRQKTQSLINSAFSGKQSVNNTTSGINDAKAVELLNRQYEKVLMNLNAAKASGIQLSESEIAGINRRIEALNNLSSRQKKQEADQASLASAQLRAQTQVNNLMNNKNVSNGDKEKLASLLKQLNDLTVGVKNFKGEATKLTQEIRQIGESARGASEQTKTFGNSLKSAFTNILMYAGVGSVFFGSINALKEMTSTIITVDNQITQMKRVMNSDTDFDNMLSSSVEIANDLSRSISEVNTNVIEFSKMGFDESQTLALAETATLFQNISDLTPNEAVDTLTAALTVFNVEAGKSIEVVDAINSVDNDFAVSSQNLSLAITKAGSTAKLYGVTLQKLIGDTTAITTVTRESGAVVGNGLKSIYSRLTTMEKSESILNAVGIKMRDLNDEVRDAPEILDELAGKWNNLSKEQQQNTAVGLAGRYQLSRFTALMQNYQISLNATETALHSQSSAVSENSKYLQSLDSRIQKMKTSWDTLALSVGNSLISDSIVVITSLLTSMGKAFTFVVDKLGVLPVLFGAAYMGLMLLNTAFKVFIINITTSISSLFGLTTATNGAKLGFIGLSASAKIAGISIKSMLISTVVGAGLVVLGGILEKLIGHFSKSSEVIDGASTSLEKLNDTTSSLKELQDLSNEYDLLAKKTDMTTQEKIRLASVESDLASKHGITMRTVEDQTDAVEANTIAIGERIDKLKEEAAIEQQKALDEYKANKTQINADIQKQDATKKAAQAELEYLSKMQKQLEADIANKVTIKNDKGQLGNFSHQMTEIKPSDYDTSGLDGISEAIAQAILDAKKKVDDSGLELDKAVSKREQAFKAEFSAYADTIEAGGTKVKASTRVLADGFASIMATSNVDDLKILEQYKNEIFSIFQNTEVNNLDQAVAALERFTKSGSLMKDQFNILQTAISQLNFQGVNEGVEEIGDSAADSKEKIISLADAMSILDSAMNGSSGEMTAFVKSVSASSDEIKMLTSVQDELKESNTLSASTIEKMNEKYGDFIQVTGLSKDKVLEFISAKKDEKIALVNAEIAMTKQAIEGSKTRIKAMGIEAEAISAMVVARKALAQQKINDLRAGVADGSIDETLAEKQVAAIMRSGDDKILDYNVEQAKLDGLIAKLNVLSVAQAEFKTSGTSTTKDKSTKDKKTKSKSETAKDVAEFKDATQQRINAINAQHEAQSALNKLYSKKSSNYESDKNYPAAIQQTTELIKGQQLETSKLQEANKKLISARDEVQSKNKKYNMLTWIDANSEATVSFTNLYNSMSSKTAQEALQSQFDQFQAYTKAIRENKVAITENIDTQKESQKLLANQKLSNTNVWLEKMSKSYETIQEKIDDSKDVQSLLNEDSAEYRKELKKQVEIYKEKQAAVEKDTESIKARIKQSENAKAADKLSVDQLEALNQQLKKNNDTWYETALAIKNATAALVNLATDAINSLFDTLKSSLTLEDVLNVEEFKDSIDSIIASLDSIDGKFLSNVNFMESTDGVRANLTDIDSKVKDIVTKVKSALETQSDLSNITYGNIANLGNQITKQINLVGDLKNQLEEVNNTIRDTELQYKKEEDALDDLVKQKEKYYDAEIKKQQDILSNLDDQIEKEDRLKALNDINDELNKVKNDRRFSYITQTGEEILTYDKARVDELEKQKDELVKQYEREDVKSAIQAEIDRLEKEKSDTITILQEKLDKTKQIHQQNLEALRIYQSSLSSLYDKTVTDTQAKLEQYQSAIIKGMEDGTISADQGTQLLQNVVDGWQSSSLVKWDSYIATVTAKLNQLKNIYAEMANAALPLSNQDNSSVSSGSGSTWVDPGWKLDTGAPPTTSEKLEAIREEAAKGKHWDGVKWTYHTGGTAGEKPLAKNELTATLKYGEEILTEDHKAKLKQMFMAPVNFINTMASDFQRSIAKISSSIPSISNPTPSVAAGSTYHFGDVTVKANNPTEFWQGMDSLIKSQRK